MAREEPGSCPHHEAHYTLDLDAGPAVASEGREFYYECPQCDTRGPLSPLEDAKQGFHDKIAHGALETKREANRGNVPWPPEEYNLSPKEAAL